MFTKAATKASVADPNLMRGISRIMIMKGWPGWPSFYDSFHSGAMVSLASAPFGSATANVTIEILRIWCNLLCIWTNNLVPYHLVSKLGAHIFVCSYFICGLYVVNATFQFYFRKKQKRKSEICI